jgi:hypothetical protein
MEQPGLDNRHRDRACQGPPSGQITLTFATCVRKTALALAH